MADASDLLIAALLKSQDDYKTDPLYLLGAKSIASPPISADYRMSPMERLAAGFATGLGGSLLQSIAKGQSSSDNDVLKLAKALTGTDAEKAAAVSSDPSLSKYQEIADLLQKEKADAAKSELGTYAAKKKLDALINPQGKTLTTVPISATQEQSAWIDEAGAPHFVGAPRPIFEPKEDMNALKPKDIIELENNRQSAFIGNQLVKDVQQAETGFQSMLKSYNDTSGASDIDFFYGGIQAVEPGLAVKDDERSLVKAGSGLGGVFAEAAGYVQAKKTIPQEVRAGILRLAGNRRDARLSQYNDYVKNISDSAKGQGLDPTHIVPYSQFGESSPQIDAIVGSSEAPPPGLTFPQYQAWKRAHGK